MDKRMNYIIVLIYISNLEKGRLDERLLLCQNNTNDERKYETHKFDHFNNI